MTKMDEAVSNAVFGSIDEPVSFDIDAFHRALRERGYVVVPVEQSNSDSLALSTYCRDQVEKLGGSIGYNESGLLARRIYGKITGTPWGAP